MDKFNFNFELITCLSSVLDLTVTEIARRCEISQSTLRLYVKQERVIPLQTIIEICNTLHIPTRYFFYEKEAIIPTRERATIEAEHWLPIEWDNDAVEKTFGDAPRHIYWKNVAKAIGVSNHRPRGRFALKTRFPVDDFLTVCNTFNLSPYTFLIDHNPIPGGASFPTSHPYAPTVIHPKNSLRADVAAMQQKMNALFVVIDNLEQKNKVLLDRIEILSNRVDALSHRA